MRRPGGLVLSTVACAMLMSGFALAGVDASGALTPQGGSAPAQSPPKGRPRRRLNRRMPEGASGREEAEGFRR